MRSLRLYVRAGCHLCEDMQIDLQRLLENREITLEMVDVDRSPDNLENYSTRIPVLESTHGDCLSEYFLDEVKLMNYLNST